MEQISRFGSYGILSKDACILLTSKKSGPYRGLLDLPGGGIEFGETPEGALQRELLEEVGMAAKKMEFIKHVTATDSFIKQAKPCMLHQIGSIYHILDWKAVENAPQQEEHQWVSLSGVVAGNLTPFAKEAISYLLEKKSWRPINAIRGKSIGIAKHKNCILVCEVRNDKGTLKGWVPLGGGIEFGETAEEALKREIQEEVGSTVQVLGAPTVLENIFEHHGAIGHEIVFAFPIDFDQKELYQKTRFQISENNGSIHWVEWVPIERFLKQEAVLFPLQIVEKLLGF